MIILMTMNFDNDDDEAHDLIVFSLTQMIGVVFLGYSSLVQVSRIVDFLIHFEKSNRVKETAIRIWITTRNNDIKNKRRESRTFKPLWMHKRNY